jgi:hypothetical protein
MDTLGVQVIIDADDITVDLIGNEFAQPAWDDGHLGISLNHMNYILYKI